LETACRTDDAGELSLHVAIGLPDGTHIVNLNAGPFACLAAQIKTFDKRPNCDSGRIKDGGFSGSIRGYQYSEFWMEVNRQVFKTAIVFELQSFYAHGLLLKLKLVMC
jgi:hypothetical protein